jgi:hypothetical protein
MQTSSGTRTDALIEQLATRLGPPPSRERRFAITIAFGVAIALGLVGLLLGFRADLAGAVFTSTLWMKWGFALVTAAAAFFLCVRLARPESKPGWWPFALLLPILVLVVTACVQLVSTPAPERRMIWLGNSAAQCLWCIPLLAVPLLIGALWAFRQFAPTRLRLAGFSAGLLAGAAAAAVYALHCDETEPAFVATWYSAGMLLPALIGLVLGPRVLRW